MTEDASTLALRLAVFDLMKDRVTAGITDTKALAERTMAVGDRKVVRVPTPHGQEAKVATVTYVERSGGGVLASFTDDQQFTDWARREHPEGVRDVPVVADWVVAEARQRALAGEAIPGIELFEVGPGTPYVRVQRDKSPEAQAALMDFLFSSPDAIANMRSLLAIEPPAEEQA